MTNYHNHTLIISYIYTNYYATVVAYEYNIQRNTSKSIIVTTQSNDNNII